MPHWYRVCRSPIMVLHAVIAVALFAYSLKRRKGFAWRLPLTVVVAMSISYLLSHFFYQPGATGEAILTQAFIQLANYLLVLGIVQFCLDESFWTVLYVSTSGMAAQGLAGCLKTIVKCIPFMNALAHHDLGILPVDMLCYGGVFTALFFIFRVYTSVRQEAVGSRAKAIVSTVVLAFFLANSWLIRDYSNGQIHAYVVVTNIYAILVQALIFLVQYNVLERGRLNQHLETMRELMHEQRMQYESSRENVQLINEKYHDLKKLINDIQNVIPEKELSRLKTSIDQYDVRVRTGYEVLDVVLMEKMNLCLQRGITMTCNLGTVDFSFLDELDLYALFNNALSNAVNAVSALPEGRQRYIILTAAQEGNMLSIHFENPCYERLEFVDGLPQTSGDPDWHGFGMKSMSHIAEKYGGVLSAAHHNGSFQLDVLLLNQKDPDV